MVVRTNGMARVGTVDQLAVRAVGRLETGAHRSAISRGAVSGPLFDLDRYVIAWGHRYINLSGHSARDSPIVSADFSRKLRITRSTGSFQHGSGAVVNATHHRAFCT